MFQAKELKREKATKVSVPMRIRERSEYHLATGDAQHEQTQRKLALRNGATQLSRHHWDGGKV